MAFFFIEPPQLMGITGDECASCNSTDAPIYALSCHESDDFHCRNCLTETYYEAADDVVRCPHVTCGYPTGLKPLIPLEGNEQLNTDPDVIEAIRQQPEVMNNFIAFTAEEARSIFYRVYSMFEDQTLDPVALGGIAHHFLEHEENSLQTGFECNPFVVCFLSEVATVPKMMTTPHNMDEDLAALLESLLHGYRQLKNEDMIVDVDMLEEKIREIKGNWEVIIRKWVELVTWRHLERFA